MNEIEKFSSNVADNIVGLAKDQALKEQSLEWMLCAGGKYNYSYNFSWMGRPIIQLPQDMVAMQEIIWSVKPDLIIETGIAHGGSLVLSASMLAMLDYAEAKQNNQVLDPSKTKRKVIGIDIDIREHNREAIEAHPMSKHIQMLQGSSIDPHIANQVKDLAEGHSTILVSLDSHHTHEHVLRELELYAPLVSKNSYCVVFDTLVDDLPNTLYGDRPWGPDNNPKTAVYEFLKDRNDFIIDKSIHDKLLISVAPDGFLKRIE
jgi:cephalosporin hydroxylase